MADDGPIRITEIKTKEDINLDMSGFIGDNTEWRSQLLTIKDAITDMAANGWVISKSQNLSANGLTHTRTTTFANSYCYLSYETMKYQIKTHDFQIAEHQWRMDNNIYVKKIIEYLGSD